MSRAQPRLTVFFDRYRLRADKVDFVELNSGRLFPAIWDVQVLVDRGPWLELRLAVRDGDVVVDRFLVANDVDSAEIGVAEDRVRPLEMTEIRRLATKSVIDDVIRQGLKWTAHYEMGARQTELADIDDESTRRRRQITPLLLRLVADIARQNPRTPRKAVAEQLATGERNATRLLRAAREQGHLSEEK